MFLRLPRALHALQQRNRARLSFAGGKCMARPVREGNRKEYSPVSVKNQAAHLHKACHFSLRRDPSVLPAAPIIHRNIFNDSSHMEGLMTKPLSILISGNNTPAAELKGAITQWNPEFSVETEDSGKNALIAAFNNPYDLIISFSRLSDMQGLAFRQELTKNTIHSPFILIFDTEDEPEILDALSEGADFSVQRVKPPDILYPELADKVRRIADQIAETGSFRTPQAVKESEERYRSIIEGVPDYILVHRNRTILYANPAVLDVFDQDATVVIGSDMMDFVAPESRKMVLSIIKRRENKESVPPYEIVVNTKYGPRISEIRGSVITYEGETASIAVLTDITDKKTVELQLQKSREEYKSLVENINEMVYRIDREGNIIYISPVVETLIGVKFEAIKGRHFHEFTHPDDWKLVDEHFSLRRNSISKPVTFRAVDFHGGIHYLRSSSHTMTDNNIITGFTGTLSDFTSETLAKMELLESEQRFRSMFENSPFAYQSLDQGGTFLDVNSEWTRLTGYTRDEVIGTYFGDYWSKNSFQHCKQELSNFITRGDVNTELDLISKDGTVKSVLLSGRVQRDGEGTFVRTHCILYDITEHKHAEEYTRLLARMLDDAPASIIVHDFSGRIIYANEEAFQIHGFSSTEFLALNLYDLNVTEGEEQLNERIKRVNETGELDYDTEHFRKDGSKIPLNVNVKIVEWEEKKVLLNIATDITERKKAETLLKQKNLFLQQLIDTIPGPIFYKDVNSIYIGCNSAFETYIGLSKDEIIGKTVYEISPADLADVYREHDQALFSSHGVETYETGLKYADGSIHDVIFYKATYDDINGDVAGLVGIILDISERKEMEDALKQSEAKFKSYVAYAREGIYIVVPSGKIIDANPAASDILGYTKDELLTFKITDLVPPEDIESAMTRFRDVVEIGHLSDEFVTVRKDGMQVPVIINAVLLPDGNTLAIHTDISELKRAEEAIKEANRKLNLLSSITRHDILNQLTAVIAYLEIIEMDGEIPKGSQTESYLRKVSGASETIKRQILFTKDYKDMGEQAPKWQNVGTIVDDIAKISAFESLKVENTLEDMEIYGDPLFEKVIYNLFDNAVKHGETITKIRFEQIKSSNGMTIVCEDDGMGVPDEYKTKIFNRQHYTNTGLGLFLSGDILSITGITMKETGIYGKGARFEILVPAGMFRFPSAIPE